MGPRGLSAGQLLLLLDLNFTVSRFKFLLKAYAEIHEGYQTYLAAAGGLSAGNGVGGD